MKRTLKLIFIYILLFLNSSMVFTFRDYFDNWSCTYLDPQIVYKINAKEIHTIVEIGSDDGWDAVLLNRYYKCPVFLFENSMDRVLRIQENMATYKEITLVKACEIDTWISQADASAIDLLCINKPGKCLSFLQRLENSLDDIKYILVSDAAITSEVENYLQKRKFKSFFSGISLLHNVLFIHEKVKDFTACLKNYAMPLIDPLLPGDPNSELMHAAWSGEHPPFHYLAGNKDLDINYQDSHGNTAFIIAAARCSEYPLRKLMQQKDLNFKLQNKKGCTALMVATALGHVSCVQLILEDPRGRATIDMEDNLGMTAEEIAHLVRSSEIVDYIHDRKHNVSDQKDTKVTGYPRKVISEKVIICGVCRDVADYLPDTIKIMEKIGGLFEDYRVIVCENNSTDSTKSILQTWMNTNQRVCAYLKNLTQKEIADITINTHNDGTPFKVDFIAWARNIVLDQAMSSEFEEFPYIIMMDMDFESPPDAQAIVETFQSERDWDAVFAYGIGKTGTYWDWYALRDLNEPLGPELVGSGWFTKKHWSLYKTDRWCKVYSAFGGLGIYKKSSIQDCRYASIVTEDMEKVFQKVIADGKALGHPVILKYLDDIKDLRKITISPPGPNLPYYKDADVGILLSDQEDALVWRMNSSVWQYPAVVDHLPFHASMIARGHDKLFINPRLVLEYTR